MVNLEENTMLIMRWDKKNLEALKDAIELALPMMSYHNEGNKNNNLYFNHEAILEIYQLADENTSVTLQWYNSERDDVDSWYFGDDEIPVYIEE